MKTGIITSILLFFAAVENTHAQYTVNGNATQISCNEYRLTDAQNFLSGSVWNNNRISLNQSFDFKFDIFLGSNNSPGADGIAFVLQPISTSVGSSGGGLGYDGITPAVGVTIDTYQNAGDNDPVFDHIAVQLNGNLNHSNVNNIAGPVSAVNGNDNIEDGQWHALRITWNTITKEMTTYVDGVVRVIATKDLVTDVFAGNPLVYWGFTGSTGGENNLQKFKIALNPAFVFNANQKRCINEPITFKDSTISFTPIVKFYWNFGDGSPIDSVNLNPVHTYTTAGDFTVVQRVIGADGCEATNTQTVQVGSKPIANFGYSSPLCSGIPVQFSDSSFAAVGIINAWSWIENGMQFSTQQNPSVNFALGVHSIRLVATSNAGCVSNTVAKAFLIEPGPDVNFSFTDACSKTSVNFSAVDNSGTVVDWKWTFGDGGMSASKDTQYVYNTTDTYPVKLIATAANGCNSTLQNDIVIFGTNAFAGNDTTVASGQPLQLQASGGINYEWTPPTGLSNPFIANPVAILTGSQLYTYRLRAYTPLGCESFDTIIIQVYQAPEIYLPNAFNPSGINTVYRAYPIGIREFKYLQIFNRYGQTVFYSTDVTKGWDGTYKGKKQNSGVYVAIASGTDYRGLPVERKAAITLIR